MSLTGGKGARLTSFHTRREVRDEKGRFISLQGLTTTHSEDDVDEEIFGKKRNIVVGDGINNKKGRRKNLFRRQQTIDAISLAKMSTFVSFVISMFVYYKFGSCNIS